MKNIAKITRPRISGVVLRKRLFSLLDSRGRQSRVIWVSGPAGSGKTTLVASWLDARKLPCLWYQVDEGDKDIASFFYYMGLAAGKAAPRYRKPLPLLTPEYLPAIPTFTRRWSEDLFRRLAPPHSSKSTKRGFAIVLDNFQDAVSESFHDTVNLALDSLPEEITAIVLSRTDPPAALSRLREKNKMNFLGWNDLSFSLQECREFLNKRHKKLPDESVAKLREKTEGWAAGLVLMTEMAKTKEVEYSLISELSREAVFSYFAHEILEKTDRQTRDFLLRTSFFNSLTPSAAEKVTGNAGAGSILARLSRDHYFTDRRSIPLPFYQYHQLFREFLRSRAMGLFSPEDIAGLKRATGSVLEAEGRIDEAAVLFVETEAWEMLAGLVLKNAQDLIFQGRGRSVEEWIRSIPAETISNLPWLVFWSGACRISFSPTEARGHFEEAYHLFKRTGERTGLLLSWASIVNTFVYEWNDFRPLDGWIAEIRDALSEMPDLGLTEVSAQVAVGMFNALMWRQPQDSQLPFWAEQVIGLTLSSNNAQMRMILGNTVVVYYLWIGDVSKAALVVDSLKPEGRMSESNA